MDGYECVFLAFVNIEESKKSITLSTLMYMERSAVIWAWLLRYVFKWNLYTSVDEIGNYVSRV